MIGISCLTGNYKYLCSEVMRLLKEKGATDILVIAGGIIPPDHIPLLKAMGVKAAFGPGSRVADIVTCIRENVRQ